MFRPLCLSSGVSKLMLETTVLSSMYTVQNFTLLNAPIHTVLLQHVLVIVLAFQAWSTLLFLIVWLDLYWLVVLGDLKHYKN
jgi:hypothetical protein